MDKNPFISDVLLVQGCCMLVQASMVNDAQMSEKPGTEVIRHTPLHTFYMTHICRILRDYMQL